MEIWKEKKSIDVFWLKMSEIRSQFFQKKWLKKIRQIEVIIFVDLNPIYLQRWSSEKKCIILLRTFRKSIDNAGLENQRSSDKKLKKRSSWKKYQDENAPSPTAFWNSCNFLLSSCCLHLKPIYQKKLLVYFQNGKEKSTTKYKNILWW